MSLRRDGDMLQSEIAERGGWFYVIARSGATIYLSLRGAKRRGNLRFFAIAPPDLRSDNSSMREKIYYVYIVTNVWNTVLYTGVTNDLERRMYEHRNGLTPGFANNYHCTKLVWFDTTSDVFAAIAREKQIKAGSRAKKIALIEGVNPKWLDLLPNG